MLKVNKNTRTISFSYYFGKFKLRVSRFFYVQHFYKQRHAETGKKSSKSEGCYSKIIRFLQPPCQQKIIGDILKKVQKTTKSV